MNLLLPFTMAGTLLLGLWPATADESRADESRADGKSPSGKIAWHVVETKDGAEVLISEGDQEESAAVKVCETISLANTKVHVSPDDFWIIVESGTGSLGISLAVYQREKGMIYKEQAGTDIGGTVAKAAFKAAGNEAAAEKLDHVYAHVLAWSADSGSILVDVSGHGGKTRIGPYVAVFDLGRKTAGLDLTKFNAKAVHP